MRFRQDKNKHAIVKSKDETSLTIGHQLLRHRDNIIDLNERLECITDFSSKWEYASNIGFGERSHSESHINL